MEQPARTRRDHRGMDQRREIKGNTGKGSWVGIGRARCPEGQGLRSFARAGAFFAAISLLLLLLLPSTASVTELPATIAENTTLTADNPYNGSSTIKSGVTLTIEPGVKLTIGELTAPPREDAPGATGEAADGAAHRRGRARRRGSRALAGVLPGRPRPRIWRDRRQRVPRRRCHAGGSGGDVQAARRAPPDAVPADRTREGRQHPARPGAERRVQHRPPRSQAEQRPMPYWPAPRPPGRRPQTGRTSARTREVEAREAPGRARGALIRAAATRMVRRSTSITRRLLQQVMALGTA